MFRVPGSHSTVKKIVDLFNEGTWLQIIIIIMDSWIRIGKNPDFDGMPAFVEDVAGVFKKYLRDMPCPLLSDGTPEDLLQNRFLDALCK